MAFDVESGRDWSASALFSPSKARVQQAQAKDWVSVDSWLSNKYASKRIPQFERNEETLQALLTLAALNDDMDELRMNVDRVEKLTLESLTKQLSNVDPEMYKLLVNKVQSSEALETIAQVAVDLSAATTSSSTLATAIINLTSTRFEISQQEWQAESQIASLQTQQMQLNHTLEALVDDVFRPPSDLQSQTIEWIKSTKHIKAKSEEYEDRFNTKSVSQAAALVDQVLTDHDNLEASIRRLKDLKVELQASQDLPADAKAARVELEKQRSRLRKLL